MNSKPFVYRKDSLLEFFGAGLEMVQEEVLACDPWDCKIKFRRRKVALPAGVERSICGYIEERRVRVAPLYAYVRADGRGYREFYQDRECDTGGDDLYFVGLRHAKNGKPVKETLWTREEVFDVQYGEWLAPLEERLTAFSGVVSPTATSSNKKALARMAGRLT